MCSNDGLVHGEMSDKVVLHPGRRRPEGVAHDADEVELVDGAGPTDEIAEVGCRPGDETGEDIGSVRSLPPTPVGQPGRGREVMERHDRGDAALAAGCTDAAVVVERSDGELALGGLDAAPLEGEPVRLETHVRHELDIFGPSVE